MRITAATDEELASWAAQGYEEALTEILARYDQVCILEAREWANLDEPLEDRVMEARAKLIVAARTYDPAFASKFKSWAKLLIRNRFRDLYRMSAHRKGLLTTSSNAPIGEDGSDTLEDLLASSDDTGRSVEETLTIQQAIGWLKDPGLVKAKEGQPVLWLGD